MLALAAYRMRETAHDTVHRRIHAEVICGREALRPIRAVGIRGMRLLRVRVGVPRPWMPYVVGVGAMLAMALRLFVPHPVGMANNGDAARLLCPLGANPDAPPKLSAKWYFVRLNYAYGSSSQPCGHYSTTQMIQMRLTAWIHHYLLGLSGAIDTRELMAEYCLLVGLVMAAATWLLRPVAVRARVALLTALFLVLAEANFADYAGSPYTETAALYGLLIVAVAAVAAATTKGPWSRTGFLVAWAAALLAVGAKDETTTLCVPLVLLLGTRRFEFGRLSGRYGARAVPAICALTLVLTAAWSLSNAVPKDKQINAAEEITMTIMPISGNPAQVADGLGLPRSFGQYSGTAWWGAKTIESDPLYSRYQNRITQANIARLFAAHPTLAARVFAGGATSYLDFREGYLGSYAIDAGQPPGSQECRVCILQNVSHAMRWSGFPGVLAYWLACIAGALLLIRTSRAGTRRRAYGLVSMALISAAVIQYATAVYGEGNEVVKHLSVGLFAAALAPLWLIAGALHKRESASPLPESAEPAEAARRILSSRRSEPSRIPGQHV